MVKGSDPVLKRTSLREKLEVTVDTKVLKTFIDSEVALGKKSPQSTPTNKSSKKAEVVLDILRAISSMRVALSQAEWTSLEKCLSQWRLYDDRYISAITDTVTETTVNAVSTSVAVGGNDAVGASPGRDPTAPEVFVFIEEIAVFIKHEIKGTQLCHEMNQYHRFDT